MYLNGFSEIFSGDRNVEIAVMFEIALRPKDLSSTIKFTGRLTDVGLL